MEKKPVTSEVCFANTKFKYFEMCETTNLIIHLYAKDDKIIKLFFYNVLFFSCDSAYHVSNFFEVPDSPILKTKLEECYTKKTILHPYKFYQIEEKISDLPFIQLIAIGVSIWKDG